MTYQPTFSYHVDPLLNISPLIDLHSSCLSHVVDTDGVFHLQSHHSPIVLSYRDNILNSSISYQESFAGVRAPRCLLTIAAFFITWNYDLETVLRYIIPSSYRYHSYQVLDHPIRAYARIFPQSFIILTNQSSISVDNVITAKNTVSCIDDLSPIFALQLSHFKTFPRVHGAGVQKTFQDLSFNCSTLESCSLEIEHTVNANAKLVEGSWRYFSDAGDHLGGHPFQRGLAAGMDAGIESFILEPPDKRIHSAGSCSPSFVRSEVGYLLPPMELIPTGRTALVKFVTTAGVFAPKSSYHVYFTPFFPKVWLSILISAAICLAAMIGSFQMHVTREESKFRLLRLNFELATWILAAAIGQYKHSGVPLIAGHTCKEVVRITLPVVVAWFILATFLTNVYSAIFSSDATRSFYYLTNYTELLQLTVDTLIYLLVNESYVSQYYKEEPDYDYKSCNCIVRSIPDFCDFHKYVLAACTTYSGIENAQLKSWRGAVDYRKTEIDQTWKVSEQHRLDDVMFKMGNLRYNSAFVCASTEVLNRILRQSEKPMALLISDHDFPKYWELFVQVMKSDPTVKVANNFNSDDFFLVEPVMFGFTSGLHQAYKGSAAARMKVLLSSGIYGLWEKWHRIKFTDGGPQHAEKLRQENKVDPLSFDNSGTSWVFGAQVFAWLGATSIFIGELVFRAFAFRSWNLLFGSRMD